MINSYYMRIYLLNLQRTRDKILRAIYKKSDILSKYLNSSTETIKYKFRIISIKISVLLS